MTNILDTVEPDARVVVPLELGSPDSPFPELRFTNGSHTRLDDGDTLYSRETVERLLAEHRKQVFLEAAEVCRNCDAAGFGATSAADELISLAEGEK